MAAGLSAAASINPTKSSPAWPAFFEQRLQRLLLFRVRRQT